MTETSEVLAVSRVQQAIGTLCADAARVAGIASHHAEAIRMSIVGRLETGAPIPSAIALVDEIRKAEPWPGPR